MEQYDISQDNIIHTSLLNEGQGVTEDGPITEIRLAFKCPDTVCKRTYTCYYTDYSNGTKGKNGLTWYFSNLQTHFKKKHVKTGMQSDGDDDLEESLARLQNDIQNLSSPGEVTIAQRSRSNSSGAGSHSELFDFTTDEEYSGSAQYK